MSAHTTHTRCLHSNFSLFTGMENAWNQIGNYYADRLKWEKAAEYVHCTHV
jgi:hypothetical protein